MERGLDRAAGRIARARKLKRMVGCGWGYVVLCWGFLEEICGM